MIVWSGNRPSLSNKGKTLNYEEVINGYNDLRERCLKLAKDSKDILGEYSWLRGAITESDITLYFYDDRIECNGVTYTSQTMDHEFFTFLIPISMIEENNA